MKKEEPPDKFRCIKLQLKTIIRKKEHARTIFNAVFRSNKITIKTYLLLRLWILEKYHSNQIIPEITEDTILTIMQTLNSKSYSNSKIKPFYQEIENLFKMEKEDGSFLTQILNYKAKTILTMLENNIKANFFNYIRRYVNSYYLTLFAEELETKKIDKKIFFKEIEKVKDDLINRTLTSDKKYHSWLLSVRDQVLPALDIDSIDEMTYYIDVKINPQRYIKSMIWMSSEIEKLDKKMFQFCPLQTNIIPKFIQIDTASLIALFVETNKLSFQQNVEKEKQNLWSDIFKMKKIEKLNMKNYSFNYSIFTDGFSVSVQLLNHKYVESEKQKRQNMLKAREEMRGKTEEEKEEIRNEKKQKNKNKLNEKLKEKINCICGVTISKSSLFSHKKTTKHLKFLKENEIIEEDEEPPEFRYFTEINKEDLTGKHVFIDPGKRDLLSMMDDDGKRKTYSNSQRIKETHRLEYQNKLQKYRDEKGICEKENELSDFFSKTCDLMKFRMYIEKKLEINNFLYESYCEDIFRQYKHYAYISKKRSEAKLLDSIESYYGKDIIIIIGDWSRSQQMRNFISTPNLSLKRKLKERFRVYEIDEYRTSCLHHKTEVETENLVVKDWYLPKIYKKQKFTPLSRNQSEKLKKTYKTRTLHAVLTFQMENKRRGCINRDYNGCLNMKKIFDYYMLTGERPYNYRRSTKSTDPKFASNSTQPFVKQGQLRFSI